jgi:hypothetical protein
MEGRKARSIELKNKKNFPILFLLDFNLDSLLTEYLFFCPSM